MNLPLTREDLNSFLVTSGFIMDSDSPWCRKLSKDKIIEEVFTYAEESNSDYSCHAFYYDEDYDDLALAIITLNWDNETGFSASLAIQYSDFSDEEYFRIDLDKVPMKKYGEVELYDFNEIINRGIELFNSNFDINKYHDINAEETE